MNLRDKSETMNSIGGRDSRPNISSRLTVKHSESSAHYERFQQASSPRSSIRDSRQLSTGNRASTPSCASSSPAEVVADREKGKMMTRLCEMGDFVRRFRVLARFGDLSRAPLTLVRLQICGDVAECDWTARPPDMWDANIIPWITETNISTQALKDAIEVRNLLFRLLPGLRSAVVRVYRKSTNGPSELIITGTVSRDQRAPVTVRSLAMRAKLFGLRFWLDDGILESLQPEECAVNS